MIEGMLLTLDVLGMLLLIRWSLGQDAKLRGEPGANHLMKRR
jgi:hypothetical protein